MSENSESIFGKAGNWALILTMFIFIIWMFIIAFPDLTHNLEKVVGYI